MACSTAAGPAFEGASIFKGMRAAEGAIEKIKIDDDVHIRVIGNTDPVGICGSGIIDAAAQLLINGLIDRTGKFIKPPGDGRKRTFRNRSSPVSARGERGKRVCARILSGRK